MAWMSASLAPSVRAFAALATLARLQLQIHEPRTNGRGVHDWRMPAPPPPKFALLVCWWIDGGWLVDVLDHRGGRASRSRCRSRRVCSGRRALAGPMRAIARTNVRRIFAALDD